MGLFGSKQPEYMGIDIGTTGVRLVQLKPGATAPELVTYGAVELPPGVAQSDAPSDIAKVAAAVKQVVKDSRASAKYVVAGVPSSKVFASVITTPKLSPGDLAKAITLQADQYIPMSIKEVKIDWYVIGPGKKDTEQEVLLVAAPNTVTAKYVSLFNQAGLELKALEPNAVALARAIVPPNDLAVLTLDIGSVASDITIVQANMPKLLRAVTVGGDTFVKAVGSNLGLDAAQADQFTKKFGLTQTKLEGQVAKAIKPSLDQLLAEVEKSIKFFQSQYPEVTFEKVVLTGGTTALPELTTYLATAIGLPIEIANSWVKVRYPAAKQDELMRAATHFGVAAGLAERDVLK